MNTPTVHVFFSNLGGSGKTTSAALTADYLQSQGKRVRCFDGDPVLHCLSHYKSLHAEQLVWDSSNDDRARREFERVFGPGGDSEIRILDCGPPAFFPFCSFLNKADLSQRTNWHLHFMLPVDRLHEASLRCLEPARPLPFVFWLNQFGLSSDVEAARVEALERLPIKRDEVRWIDFGAREDEARRVFRHHKTMSEYVSDSSLMDQVRAKQFQEKWVVPMFERFFEADLQ